MRYFFLTWLFLAAPISAQAQEDEAPIEQAPEVNRPKMRIVLSALLCRGQRLSQNGKKAYANQVRSAKRNGFYSPRLASDSAVLASEGADKIARAKSMLHALHMAPHPCGQKTIKLLLHCINQEGLPECSREETQQFLTAMQEDE